MRSALTSKVNHRVMYRQCQPLRRTLHVPYFKSHFTFTHQIPRLARFKLKPRAVTDPTSKSPLRQRVPASSRVSFSQSARWAEILRSPYIKNWDRHEREREMLRHMGGGWFSAPLLSLTNWGQKKLATVAVRCLTGSAWVDEVVKARSTSRC
jgi:hypothetical protein